MTLTIVAVIFGVFAIGLIVPLIYKSTLTMHRNDQLFLDEASSHMQAEQTELLAKVNQLIILMLGEYASPTTSVWSKLLTSGKTPSWS